VFAAHNDNGECNHCPDCGHDTKQVVEWYGGMSFASKHCCNCAECTNYCPHEDAALTATDTEELHCAFTKEMYEFAKLANKKRLAETRR
jgi:hypothetical protein